MKETLQFLTQIQPPRNFMNRHSLNAVAEYIKNRFKDYGLMVEFQEFSVGNSQTMDSKIDTILITAIASMGVDSV